MVNCSSLIYMYEVNWSEKLHLRRVGECVVVDVLSWHLAQEFRLQAVTTPPMSNLKS